MRTLSLRSPDSCAANSCNNPPSSGRRFLTVNSTSLTIASSRASLSTTNLSSVVLTWASPSNSARVRGGFAVRLRVAEVAEVRIK